MAICPILVHADVASKNHYPWNAVDPVKPIDYTMCLGSRCQMWDEERKDCGLKHPAKEAQKTKEESSVLGLTQAQRDICYSDAPNPPSEPE